MPVAQSPTRFRLLHGAFAQTPSPEPGAHALTFVPRTRRAQPFRQDPLCGVATKRALLERLAIVGDLAPGAPLSFLVITVRGLVEVNQRDGFQASDRALQAIASRTAELTRATDLVGRLSGTRFGVVLQGSGSTSAGATASRLAHHLGLLPQLIAPLRVEVSAASGIGANARMLVTAALDLPEGCA